MNWFDVDHKGLAQVIEARGKDFLVHELIQNAWDAPGVSQVALAIERLPQSVYATVRVEDDSPEGFKNLSHSFTLFAPSEKKADPTLRGKWNMGEKLVIALCKQARIATTKGTVIFDDEGRTVSRARRATGSVFEGTVRLSTEEIAQLLAAARKLIAPPGIRTLINGEPLPTRPPVAVFDATLPTERSDSEGVLRPTERKCEVRVYEPQPGEAPSLYEMGIPVVPTSDRWHVDVQQKVPLNMNRDNVTPSYLARIRALVLEHMHARLSQDDANATWVKDAFSRHADCLPEEAVKSVMRLRFGENAVAYDPSDPEANMRAVAAGHTLVHGGHMSAAEWSAARRFGFVPAAGKVMPTGKPFGADGEPLRILPEDKWTPAIRQVVSYAATLGQQLLGRSVFVQVANDINWRTTGGAERSRVGAAFGPDHILYLNLGSLGHKWFEGPLEPINELLIHEFSHGKVSNHLSREFADEHARLGAKMVRLALENPDLFDLRGEMSERNGVAL
jgi:hypothetical protein